MGGMSEAAVRRVLGQMGEETLLASQRAVPAKLLASGFRFLHPHVRPAIAASLAYQPPVQPQLG